MQTAHPVGDRGIRRSGRIARLAVCVVATTTVVAGVYGLGTATPTHAASATSAARYVWPKFAGNAADTGLSKDPGISTANVATLGVRWMTGLDGSPVSSPVTAWNTTLGKTLVYIGTQGGELTAFDATNGSLVWSVNLGSPILATPLVEGGYIWAERAYAPLLFKLNAATGAQQCSVPLPATAYASPTIGKPNGGKLSIYIASGGISATKSGFAYGINEATCHVEWKFNNYNSSAGTWDPLSFGTDVNGRSLVLFGSDDPDDSVYAVDARTGTKVWSFKTPPLAGNTDIDIGAGITVSPPGTNGFADGVAYVPAEDGYVFALDLTTGKEIWSYQFGVGLPQKHLSRSTAALFGQRLVFGTSGGATCVNAVTGKLEWKLSTGGVQSLAAPVVAGPSGKQIVAITTLAGDMDVLKATTGTLLYTYQTPGYIVSSFADVNGTLVTASTDGYLYDMAPGGGNGSAPSTAITSPENGGTVANPGGTLTITGMATGTSIASVAVAIQAGGSSGQWWNGQKGSWTSAFFDNPAAVTDPGAASTTWSLTLPVPPTLGTYQVMASAAETNGVADVSDLSASPGASNVTFTVINAPGTPTAAMSGTPWIVPGGEATVTGSGFGPSEAVVLSLAGTKVGSGTTDTDGDLPSTSITVPRSGAFGPVDIVATGQTSGRIADIRAYVSNDWTQSGYDSTHSGMEPNDQKLLHAVAPGPPVFLTMAWSLLVTAPLQTSVAVAQDVAYVGDDSGTVTAIDVRNSEPLWSTTETSAIDSSPAVSDSLVFFGTEGGSVVALNRTDGSQAWSAATSSKVESAPALANQEVFVGSDDGTVYALNQASGAIEWQHKVSAAVMGSPAVDPGSGIVVVGDSSGAVTALSMQSGSVLWTHATGGAVTASPTLYNGSVYVGSADSTVYALSESTGQTVWTAPVPAPVTATGAIYAQPTPADYVVGAQDGSITYLDLTDGAVKHTAQVQGAVVGLASAVSWLTATTASGQIDGLKRNAEIVWQTSIGGPFASAPTIVNGVVYAAGTDDAIRAYTPPGTPIP